MSSIRSILNQPRTKDQMMSMVDMVAEDNQQVEALVECIFDEEVPIAFYAAWTLGHVADQNLLDLSGYVEPLLSELYKPRHPSIERCLIKVLINASAWPEDRFSEIVDHLLGLVVDNNALVAARCLSMEGLLKHLQTYPEILAELKEGILLCMDYGSAAYKARGRHTIKAIEKLGY